MSDVNHITHINYFFIWENKMTGSRIYDIPNYSSICWKYIITLIITAFMFIISGLCVYMDIQLLHNPSRLIKGIRISQLIMYQLECIPILILCIYSHNFYYRKIKSYWNKTI